MDELNTMLSNLTGVCNPATGKPIRFNLKKGQHYCNYFDGPRGEMFCYTPHPDVDGNYWCFTYQPYGAGSRSGDPKRWKVIKLVRCSRRKVACQKARQRLTRAHGQGKVMR
jgi:hypothetical protein